MDFCHQLGIQNKFVSVIHPQANGQAESANKMILNGIKKNLEAAKGLWAEQLHEVNPFYFQIITYSSIGVRFYYEKNLS